MAEAVGLEGLNTEQLRGYVEATLQSPVMGTGNTFERQPGDVDAIMRQLGHVAAMAVPTLVQHTQEGMGWGEATATYVVTKEVIVKDLAFYAALGLTDGRIRNPAHRRRLGHGAIALGLMYIGDQSGDRGDSEMGEACRVLGILQPKDLVGGDEKTQKTRSRLGMLMRIEEGIRGLARPKDVPYVLECFYKQVLHNEVRIQDLTRGYLESGSDPAFITRHARELAEITTTSAGLPCVSRGIYATYRSHNPKFGAPLADITAHPLIQEAEQVMNAIVRIWDELGDWEMDTGKFPKKGIKVINPFNEYDPAFVERYCELAHITDPGQIASLQQAFAEFHNSDEARQTHGTHILETLRLHARNYTNGLLGKLPPELQPRFALYIDICKRVLEIGWVNKIGDIALSS